jgi:NAD-dependent dihydropyrimidine dehydrogenase PreA subunit
MFQVQFGLQDRLEQALSTAWCYTMTLALPLIFWPLFFLKVVGVIFFVYLFGFLLYPLFPDERRWRRTLTIAGLLMGPLAAYALTQGWLWQDVALWEGVLAAAIVLMSMDGCGSSPLHKSTIKHWLSKGDYDSHFSPVIDPSLCINCVQCILVCPRDVFAARRADVKTVVAVRPEQCEECLACYKQCPTDAIFNRSGEVKGDVKSIPDLEALAARDWSHLKNEERWIGMPTAIRSGIPVIAEESAPSELSGAEPRRRRAMAESAAAAASQPPL